MKIRVSPTLKAKMPKKYPEWISVSLREGTLERIAWQAAKRDLGIGEYVRELIMERLAAADNKERQKARARAAAVNRRR